MPRKKNVVVFVTCI